MTSCHNPPGETSGYQVDAATLTHYQALRAAAVAHALAASCRAHSALFARFGEQGRAACEEDLGYHLDFLEATLESGDLSPFLAYLGWLSQVLGSRGVPGDSLPASLDDLAHFFAQASGLNAAPIVAALHAGRQALAQGIAPPAYDQPCPLPHRETEAFQSALLRGNRRDASAIFEAVTASSGSLTEAEVHLIQPALYGVGREWQKNQVSVAQEHMATALSQTLMGQGLGRADLHPENGLRALFACPPGNHHTVGLRMVADAFELKGWATQYLGANTPISALLAQAREMRPHLIGLSASLPYQLRGLRQAVAALRQALSEDCPVIAVGGLVFNQFPLLARSIGAELLGPDARIAEATALQLLKIRDSSP